MHIHATSVTWNLNLTDVMGDGQGLRGMGTSQTMSNPVSCQGKAVWS